MAGPIGPPGFNGSQGPAGPAGSIGPRGPKGAGNFSACQYKEASDTKVRGSNEASIGVAEARVSELHSILIHTTETRAYLPQFQNS